MQEYIILLDKPNRFEVQKKLVEISGFDFQDFKGIFGAGVKNIKWDNSMEDMKKLSLIYKDTLFTLQYVGDKVSETYREYYLNGKVQVVPVRMSFDDFNEDYLA